MENSFKLRTGYIFIHCISNHLLVHNTYEHVFFRYLWLMNIRFFHVSQTHLLPSATLPGPKCYDGHWTADILLSCNYLPFESDWWYVWYGKCLLSSKKKRGRYFWIKLWTPFGKAREAWIEGLSTYNVMEIISMSVTLNLRRPS